MCFGIVDALSWLHLNSSLARALESSMNLSGLPVWPYLNVGPCIDGMQFQHTKACEKLNNASEQRLD